MIGHIYRIIHLESDVQYVGSTFNEPRKRWQQHKNDYNKWLSGNHDNIAIYEYFKSHGIENFKLIPIKNYEVVDRKHLEAYEQLWMSKLRCVNKNHSFQIKRLAQRHYYQENKADLQAYHNNYDRNRRVRPDNFKTTIECQCGGKYQTCSKALHFRSERHLHWVRNGVANKGSVSVKTQCQCGGQFVKKHKGAHQRSQKHQQRLSQDS